MAHRRALCDLLISCFFRLSLYAQQSIRRAVGIHVDEDPDGQDVPSSAGTDSSRAVAAASTAEQDTAEAPPAPLQEVDLLLPKVCEALVLALQCLISLTLQSEETGKTVPGVSDALDLSRAEDGTKTQQQLKETVGGSVSSDGIGFVEVLIGKDAFGLSFFRDRFILSVVLVDRCDTRGLRFSFVRFPTETLRLFDLFLPRITFGKSAPSPVLAGGAGTSGRPQPDSPPQNVVHDDTTRHGAASAPGQTTLTADPKGFLYLKRDLIRLLGILSYHSKQVQDRVRLCGGIPAVLNCCVVDERNPCKCFRFLSHLRNVWTDRSHAASLPV